LPHKEKTIRKMVKEERAGVAAYTRLGLTSIASQEKKHLKYWEDQAKKRGLKL